MRELADAARVRAFARELGRAERIPARLYLTGGATAVLEGWRPTTIDIDVRIEPDDDAILRHLPALKERLDVSVELASPLDFVPELPRWRERSPFLFREGSIDVHHFDPYSQALSKIERGFAQDLVDVEEMLERGMVEAPQLRELFAAIEPVLFRYPAIEPAVLRRKLDEALAGR